MPWSQQGAELAPSVQLWGLAMRTAAGLRLGYRLSWSAAAFTPLLPSPVAAGSSAAQRCDGLWQHTCFEAFVGLAGSDAYWEFNLSPALDWNVYRFSGFRQGQQPELAYGHLPLTVMGPRAAPAAADCRYQPPKALLEIELLCALPPALDDSLSPAGPLELGLSAVLESRDRQLSYWALQHPGAEPDFHDRRGWLLRL